MQTLKRWGNKIRIWYLEHFTDRVKRHIIEDKNTGQKAEVVVEKNIEKVCDHKTITQIAPTMWKCTGCNDAYFQISYKVMLNEQDLVTYLSDLANHLKLELKDHD